MLGLTGSAGGVPDASALRAREQLHNDDAAGSSFPDDPAAVATVAAVFPPGWAPSEDALTEDEQWELAHDAGPDLTPEQLDALMAQLPPELRDDPEMADDRDPPGMPGVLGLMPRDIATGGGFDAGGVADRLPPGLVLAAMAHDTSQAGLHRLNDDELVGLALAWRRLHSWATAGELAAVAELDRRRTRAADTAGDPSLADHLGDELAMAMTLTGRSADALLDFARALARLPATRAALADGLIDQAKAYVLANELSVLDGPLAATVERAVLARAPQQTTGQLRSAVKRAVLKADPAAASKRREAAQRNARVEVWHEPSGTATLAGRDLPPVQVLAADQRITALARRLKATGRGGTLDQLRAQVYTALLLGHPVDDPTTPAPPPAATPCCPPPAASPQPSAAQPGGHTRPGPTGEGPATTQAPAAGHDSGPTPDSAGASSSQPGPAGPGGPGGPGLGGSVNLTLPLATWLGTSDSPGDLAGLGPIPASDARTLAQLLATGPGNRWCLTLTGPGGRAIAHGCTTTGPHPTKPGTSRPGSGEVPNGGSSRGGRNPGGGSGRRGGSGSGGGGGGSGSGGGESGSGGSGGGSGRRGGSSGTGTTGAGKAGPGTAGTGKSGTIGKAGAGTTDTGTTDTGAAGPGAGGAGVAGPPWPLTITLTPLATGTCTHRLETPGYHPTHLLRHTLHIRQRTCSAPGCRRQATRCDLDHTQPYATGGRTCECGLAPLCRRHHRAKQSQGWQLHQPQPGVLTWQLPHGRTYHAEPDPYPD
jgi:hypothetical protein